MSTAGRVSLFALALVVAGCGTGPTPTPPPSPAGSASSSAPTASPSAPASLAPGSGGPSPGSPAGSPTPPLPAFRHVYLVMMENQPYDAIVGSSAAPFINGLIRRYGLATAYHAVAHPSQPNYIALFSGSTQGIADDLPHTVDAPNLADQLQAHGRTWAVFAQNVPTGCYSGSSASGGPDGTGTYARKHEPAISFAGIASDPARCARITDLSHFDPATADFELIVPNMCNDMHDCSVATGDAFLASFVPRITSSPAFADSVLFIAWDEGSSDTGGGGRVPLVVVSPLVRAGATSSVPHDHYSLLHTIQNAWGLGCLARSCGANDLRELLTP